MLLDECIRRLARLLVPLDVPVVLQLGHRCGVIAERVPVDPPRILVVNQLVHDELKLLLDDRILAVLELRHRINDGDGPWGTVAVHQHLEHLQILGLEVIPPRCQHRGNLQMHLRVVLDVESHKLLLQDVVSDGHDGLHLANQGVHQGSLLSIIFHFRLCEFPWRACLAELLVPVNLALQHDTH